MGNLILIQNIDRYLAGVMPEEERNQFEEKIRNDQHLRRKVDIQREAIKAIRRKAMREKVNRFERQLRFRRIRITIYRTLSPMAIAACFVGFFIIGPQTRNLMNIGNNTEFYASAVADMNEAYIDIKGDSKARDIILQATELLNKEQYEQADKLLSSEIAKFKDVDRTDEQAWSEKEDMLYLRSLCAIKQHKLYRSRRLLNEVVNMGSTHKEDAQRLLDKIKGRK